MKPFVFLSFLLSGIFTTSFTQHAMAAERGKPFHFAHRGGAYEFEENTLTAFRSSYEAGIRGCELDIRMTKDGELVILHDDSLQRTHQGEGPVENLQAEEARKVLSKKGGEPLPLLADFLKYFADKPGMYIEFEMKTSNKDLYPDERIEAYARKIHAAVTAKIPEGSTYVFTSFDPRPLKAVKALDPDAEIMFIKGGPLTPEILQAAKDIGAKRVACKMEGTTRLAVKDAQKQGFIVTGWPGRTMEDYFLGLGLGVDAICTDIPVEVQKYIERARQ
ncbi:glycerophosphodiester phosphodiesterase [Luteolibacter sp. SL250]|uniref:glycerophosphodiester phosphodiesterase n=1 Tax=Luteolibacter sp. SL250 TaxID=2995170 RepID=UPI00226FB6C9|nr:glycerophosphodiester phosphodiesterase [Luteolibacter sp. SL250]WAC18395.1 glycerophosphodiester phosphodiesterase [Luteolibacter sp. SL250]